MSMIRLRPDSIPEYERLHSEIWPQVAACLSEHGVTNYTITRHGELLLSYFEYVGDEYASDMTALETDERMANWLARCQRMQAAVDGGPTIWIAADEIFHMD